MIMIIIHEQYAVSLSAVSRASVYLSFDLNPLIFIDSVHIYGL